MSSFTTSPVTTPGPFLHYWVEPIPLAFFGPTNGTTTLHVPAVYTHAFPSAQVFGDSSISIAELRRHIDLYVDFVEFVHRTVVGKPIIYGYRDAMPFNQKVHCLARLDKEMRRTGDKPRYTKEDKEKRKEIKKAIKAWKKELRQHCPRRFGFF